MRRVLSYWENPSFLDIIDHTNQFRYIYSCSPFFYTSFNKIVRIFCQVVVFFTFFSKDANFKQIWRCVHVCELTSQFTKIYTKWEISRCLHVSHITGPFKKTYSCTLCFEFLEFFKFLTNDANFLQFVVAHTVLNKNSKFEDVYMFLN